MILLASTRRLRVSVCLFRHSPQDRPEGDASAGSGDHQANDLHDSVSEDCSGKPTNRGDNARPDDDCLPLLKSRREFRSPISHEPSCREQTQQQSGDQHAYQNE
jgi:hypothetical protein